MKYVRSAILLALQVYSLEWGCIVIVRTISNRCYTTQIAHSHLHQLCPQAEVVVPIVCFLLLVESDGPLLPLATSLCMTMGTLSRCTLLLGELPLTPVTLIITGLGQWLFKWQTAGISFLTPILQNGSQGRQKYSKFLSRRCRTLTQNMVRIITQVWAANVYAKVYPTTGANGTWALCHVTCCAGWLLTPLTRQRRWEGPLKNFNHQFGRLGRRTIWVHSPVAR